MGLLDKAFDVLVLRLGVIKRVYVDVSCATLQSDRGLTSVEFTFKPVLILFVALELHAPLLSNKKPGQGE